MKMFDERYEPATIISHRTSIASVLRHWKYDPAVDPHISILMRSFRLARPVRHRFMPQWDLHVVLNALLHPPFATSNPDGRSTDRSIELKWRTCKTLFLLSLATARRRSYLHALSAAPPHCLFLRGDSPEQSVLKLLPGVGFLAKNQLPSTAPKHITVPGIAHLNPDEPERMLCPVRQVGLYLRDTENIRGDRRRLFVHWDPAIQDISRAHVSRWIVLTIKEAYDRADLPLDEAHAHEVRAISASLAYLNQVPLDNVLAAALWRSQGVFQRHYLRDLEQSAQGISTLGPVVAAQAVIPSSRR